MRFVCWPWALFMVAGFGFFIMVGAFFLVGVAMGDYRFLVSSRKAKTSRSKFTIWVLVEGLESFGVDTPSL